MDINIQIAISAGLVQVIVDMRQHQQQQQQYQQQQQQQSALWTESEARWLREGVFRFGYGNWWVILTYYPFHHSRTLGYLRDRAHQMRLNR